ncbi:MAG: hypothetical protein KY447_05800 [Actinobacteria bacterium]|nr:hypothetical protein [Actinomycetota bacterium]
MDLHAVPHPVAPVRRAGFPLDHPYLEQCWTGVIGPSSVLFLRRCASLWRESMPVQVATADLGAQLGLGKGTARNSPMWHTVERVVRFRFAAMPQPGELHVYTEVPPVPARQMERLPAWCRREHERLLGQHLDGLARSAGNPTVAADPTPPPHVRMAQHLERLTTTTDPHTLSR